MEDAALQVEARALLRGGHRGSRAGTRAFIPPLRVRPLAVQGLQVTSGLSCDDGGSGRDGGAAVVAVMDGAVSNEAVQWPRHVAYTWGPEGLVQLPPPGCELTPPGPPSPSSPPVVRQGSAQSTTDENGVGRLLGSCVSVGEGPGAGASVSPVPSTAAPADVHLSHLLYVARSRTGAVLPGAVSCTQLFRCRTVVL